MANSSNPFDRAGGPPPDFVGPEAGPLADVIPLRHRGGRSATGGPAESESARRIYGAHPAGRKRPPRADPAGAPEQSEPEADREPDAYEVARAIALKKLTGAPRSRKELADTLVQRGCDPDVAGDVLDRLEEVGLIDDREFAETYVRSRRTTRGLGRRGLAAELRRKGVADEAVRDAIETIDPEDERERAAALVAKKMRAMHGLEATVQTRRLAGMLARKGYPADMAWSVIREAVADAPEHQPD